MKVIKKYSKNIKKLRQTLKLTQVEFGELCFKSYIDISRYENGHVSPSFPTAKQILSVANKHYPGKYDVEDFFYLP